MGIAKGRIAVVGAGAIGSATGGALAEAGEEVTLIARRSHVEAIQRHGLIMEGLGGTRSVPVKAAEKLDFTPALALITTKTQSVLEAARSISPYVAQTPVVLMQNTVQTDELAARVLPKENLVSCNVRIGATYLEPGKVTWFHRTNFTIGQPFTPNHEWVAQVAAILNQVAPTYISDDIRAVRWYQQVITCRLILPALTGLTMQQCKAHSALTLLAVAITREAVTVVDRLGLKLQPFPGGSLEIFDALRQLKLPLRLGDIPPLIIEAVGFVRREEIPVYGSVLQSLLREQASEVDYLMGEFVRQGQRLGVPTPLNAKLVELAHAVEKSHRFLAPQEVWQAALETGAPDLESPAPEIRAR